MTPLDEGALCFYSYKFLRIGSSHGGYRKLFCKLLQAGVYVPPPGQNACSSCRRCCQPQPESASIASSPAGVRLERQAQATEQQRSGSQQQMDSSKPTHGEGRVPPLRRVQTRRVRLSPHPHDVDFLHLLELGLRMP
jgi:hypothetical protein